MQTTILLIAVFTMGNLQQENTLDAFATVEQCEQRVTQLERLDTDITLICREE